MPRNPALLVVASGLVALLVYAFLPDGAGDVPRALLFSFGLIGTLLGGLVAFFSWQRARARATLAVAENVLARWHVDAALWSDWLAYRPRLTEWDRTRQGREMHDELRVDKVPAAGFDVIVGREAIDAGGSLHLIPLRGSPEVRSATAYEVQSGPSFLELQLKNPEVMMSSGMRHLLYTVLRIPIPATAMDDARKVAAHYNRDVPSAPDFFHGRGDGTDAEDLSRCWNCGFETHKFRSECARCGSTMQSRRWARRFGVVLTLCGIILTGLMGTVMFLVAPMILRALAGDADAGFNGGPVMASVVLLIFVGLLTFGVTTLAYGIFQTATGKRDKRVLRIILPVAGGVMALGLAIALLT